MLMPLRLAAGTGKAGAGQSIPEPTGPNRIALLLVTHHLPGIVPEIELVILLRGGRIVGDDAKAELLTEERLGALFG